MNGANEIRDELREMNSILAGLPKTMPYAVPQSYFTNLTISTYGHTEDLEDYRKKWGTSLPYTVPERYFDELPEQIADRLNAAALPKVNSASPYVVPDGYFTQLPATVLSRVRKDNTRPRKSISINAGFVRFAAAAVVVLGIGVGLQQFWSMPRIQAPERMLSSVSGNDIQEYFQRTYRADADRVLSNNDVNKMQVENRDIIQYLNETGWD